MEQNAVVTLCDGLVSVHPDFPDSLTKTLRYWGRSIGWSEEHMKRMSVGKYEELHTVTTTVDGNTGAIVRTLHTLTGLASHVLASLNKAGWQYTLVDNRTPRPSPDLEAAMSKLRPYQQAPTCQMIMSGGGIGACPTGFGKTHMIGAIVKAFPYSVLQLRGTPMTVIAAPDRDIVRKNYNDLIAILPERDVGIMMSGAKVKMSEDVMLVTLDSLHNLPCDDVGVLILDEIHAAASDARSQSISSFTKAMTWGMSATPTGRFDGRDLVTVGLAGPQVVSVTYADGVKCGALVPITVYIVELPEPEMGIKRYLNFSSRDGRYRHAVNKNPSQANEIAKIFLRAPESMQALGIMRFMEQMNFIAERAPTVEQVHGETAVDKMRQYPYLSAISKKEREDKYNRMESGEIRRAMATHVYKQGVNFPELEIIINVGGGGSDIVTKQLVGRASRKTDTKHMAYLIDFFHAWDMQEVKSKDPNASKRFKPGPVRADDMSREKAYRELGFQIIRVKSVDEIPFMKGQ